MVCLSLHERPKLVLRNIGETSSVVTLKKYLNKWLNYTQKWLISYRAIKLRPLGCNLFFRHKQFLCGQNSFVLPPDKNHLHCLNFLQVNIYKSVGNKVKQRYISYPRELGNPYVAHWTFLQCDVERICSHLFLYFQVLDMFFSLNIRKQLYFPQLL